MDAFAVLARLARQRRDEQRQALHAIDQAIAATRDRLGVLRQEMAGERRAACALRDGDLLLATYQRRVRDRERVLHAELGRLERERAAQAERLAEGRVELKRLEILLERRAERARSERARREQRAMDEIVSIPQQRRR